jgi:hypothetical protein
VWLFLVVLIYIYWMIVLVLFGAFSRFRQRRADRVRFPVFSGASEPDGWLYCPDECPIQPLGLLFGRVRAPNLLVLTSGSAPGSFVAEVADPDTAVGLSEKPSTRSRPNRQH